MSNKEKICCNCTHNIRQKVGCARCEKDGHYIGYVECFTDSCENWEKAEMNEGTDYTKTVITDIKTIDVIDGKTHVPQLDEEKNLLIPLPWNHTVLYYRIPRELIVEMVKGDKL